MIRSKTKRYGLLVAAAAIAVATPAAAKHWGPWSAPVSAESLPGSGTNLNTTSNDGCPVQSPDGLSLYIASNRPGGMGGQDIWVAHRNSIDEGWSDPVNLGPEVNSAFDDFCPLPTRGNRLFFVSRRDEINGDIYVTQWNNNHGWETPLSLGPNVNSPFQEWSPSLFEDEQGRNVLYFSSTRSGNQQDIYASVDLGPAVPVFELNTGFDDARPNVSKDGLEIVFDSTRPGTLGGPDLWTASRESTNEPWSNLTHLENGINSAAAETRATFNWDGSAIVFGSTRVGVETTPGAPVAADIFITTREKVTGKAK